jgi:hypothetical protein
MANQMFPHLAAQRGADKKFTGEFECSDCKAVFHPNPSDPAAMAEEFNAHLRAHHPAPSKRNPRDEFNKAAARLVREATERD